MNIRDFAPQLLFPAALGFVQSGRWIDCNSGVLSKFFCIKTTDLIENALSIRPILSAIWSISEFSQRFIPDIVQIDPENCSDCLNLFKKILDLDMNDELKVKYLEGGIGLLDKGIDLLGECCGFPFSRIVANVFSQELVFRLGIQKIALSALGKLIPGHTGKLLSHKITRIFLTSTLFFLMHEHGSIQVHFISGIIYGMLFEKYGILAPTVAHSSKNILVYLSASYVCQKKMADIIEASTILFDS